MDPVTFDELEDLQGRIDALNAARRAKQVEVEQAREVVNEKVIELDRMTEEMKGLTSELVELQGLWDGEW